MSSSRLSRYAAVLSILILALAHQAASLSAVYCSSENTSSNSKNVSIYQSNGLCYYFCVADYAFAVLQYNGCWCSDYVPDTTVSLSECSTTCPGFPGDLCGGDDLYGYLALTISPSGTRGSVANTAQASDGSQTSSTWTATPITSLETVTGQVRTVTVTPTAPPQSSSTEVLSRKSHGLGTAGAVGLAVGLVALVALTVAIVFFYLRKKRRDEDAKDAVDFNNAEGGDSGGGGVPSRTMSENSRYMLGTDGRQIVESWEPDNAPANRSNRLLPIDPRLNPFGLPYQNPNRSRESVNTLRDDQDYSRRIQKPVLRATNPDSDDDDGK